MKIVKYLSLALVALFATSCEKHEIEYPATNIQDANLALVQIHYFVPMASNTQNYVYKMDLDGVTYVNNNAAIMANYNGAPGGAARYYSVTPGNIDLKLYWGFWEDRLPKEAPDGVPEFYTDDYEKMELKYTGTISGLEAGKNYQVFVYDFDKAPLVFETTFERNTNITENTAEYFWVAFYNFMFEEPGVPYQGEIQYQYQYTMDWENEVKSDWLNVGEPVAFGETTGWVELNTIKEEFNSDGKARIDYRIIIPGQFDENGEPAQLQIINTKGDKYSSYSDYWNSYPGRRYHHILRGFRADKSSTVAVSSWTGL